MLAYLDIGLFMLACALVKAKPGEFVGGARLIVSTCAIFVVLWPYHLFLILLRRDE